MTDNRLFLTYYETITFGHLNLRPIWIPTCPPYKALAGGYLDSHEIGDIVHFDVIHGREPVELVRGFECLISNFLLLLGGGQEGVSKDPTLILP
jgi:hypothetical protein